ncbi:response regulator [Desulfogranum japonicum]|uniref:response regulator n=1 Tax=Desulfogranum japonicum TaxID=231447 RepID=UPI0004252606|nr:response regulator [Desulfogranum japonicum]
MKKVLIVDDEARLLQSIEAGLDSYQGQFVVVTAGNGKEAVPILEKEKIDLLVTDLRMPEMDGFELLAHVANTQPFLPSIVMTAFSTPEIEERLNASGFSKLLEKPVDISRLAATILENLNQEDNQGTMAGFSLANFLQLLAMENKTCLLRVQEDDIHGYIYLVDGEIHAATAPHLKGEEALFLLLSCDNLRITFIKAPQMKIPRIINKPLMSLLVKGMQRKDERLDPIPQHKLEDISEEHQQSISDKQDPNIQEKTTSDAPEPQGDGQTGKSAKGELDMGKLEDTLGKLQDVDGFMAVGVFTPNGEMAAQVNTSNIKLAEIGALANDVLLKAQKATDIMNVGRGQVVHIDAPKAHIFARCMNEAEDYTATQAGKAHVHIIMLLDKEGNLAMAKIKMESILSEISAFFR